MEAANTAPIRIDGALLLRLSSFDGNGRLVQAAVMVYISPDASRFYMSKEAMVQMGIISQNFPQVGSAFNRSSECASLTPMATSISSQSVVEPEPSTTSVCECPKRQYPPKRPTQLPFEPVHENTSKMKEYLLDRFESSTFNKCPHQPLPAITGPPLKIHIDPEAKPLAFLKPTTVPLHWQKQVKSELDRDVALGVIEPVPMVSLQLGVHGWLYDESLRLVDHAESLIHHT